MKTVHLLELLYVIDCFLLQIQALIQVCIQSDRSLPFIELVMC